MRMRPSRFDPRTKERGKEDIGSLPLLAIIKGQFNFKVSRDIREDDAPNSFRDEGSKNTLEEQQSEGEIGLVRISTVFPRSCLH